MTESDKISSLSWYVMRDLKRPNAKQPAYKLLEEKHFEVFTPMKWRSITKNGKHIREEVPFIQDLLFVHATRDKLDEIVDKINTLQYRYLRGGTYCAPMIVKEIDMNRFMYAVRATDTQKYYLPGELTLAMCGRTVRIIGGALNGYEGKLLTVRGSKVRRLLVELPDFFSVGVEIDPDYIQVL
ncbi:MAG: UpxY family transcription antiterminator [Muribaculaceae bacterium]